MSLIFRCGKCKKKFDWAICHDTCPHCGETDNADVLFPFWSSGYSAAKLQQPIEANPYKNSLLRKKSWCAGWIDAKE